MNGVLNIDKPAGMTSHDVVYRVRKLAGQKRVGHAGTLDPDATGVLLVCLGHATRLSDLLADQGKSYDAVVRFGVTTTTEDASGEILTTIDPSQITRADLEAVLPNFIGTISQIPPMVSAVHHQGQRLYDLARQGIVVEREPRSITIDSIELSEFTGGADCSARLSVSCGKGTYIRTLCADIGNAFGVGGHMLSLQRTSVGVFNIANAVKLENLTSETLQQQLVSPSSAVAFLPLAQLDELQRADILNGKQITSPAEPAEGDLVRLVFDDLLVALARVTSERTLQPEKVFPD